MHSNNPAHKRMDVSTICLKDDGIPNVTHVSENDGFIWGIPENKERRIRKEVYDRLIRAKKTLPEELTFVIFEVYRPLALQIRYWDLICKDIQKRYPGVLEDKRLAICEGFVANPHNGIGSGHQAGCAVDISLCYASGSLLDMGCEYHQFDEYTQFSTELISSHQRDNRLLLKTTLEDAGLVNDPAEWWHYSYGDHQWAWLTGRTEALYGPLDLP